MIIAPQINTTAKNVLIFTPPILLYKVSLLESLYFLREKKREALLGLNPFNLGFKC